MNKIIVMAIFVLALTSAKVSAQKKADQSKSNNQYSILFGLTQPLILKGFNVEAAYWTKKMVFDYSHGFNLHVNSESVGKEYEAQKINFKIAHSLGFGIGYRFTKAFNIRFEPKMHIYQTYYDGQAQIKKNSLVNFSTYTIGFGAYYRIVPFQLKHNVLKGITIVPSVRYWQQIATTLNGDKFSYLNAETKQNETFKAPNIGISNTPIIVNLSIGYTF